MSALLSDVTRDEVRKQLKIMGYGNIGDDLIDEFLHELKKSEQSSTASSLFGEAQYPASALHSMPTEHMISSTSNTDETSLLEDDDDTDFASMPTSFTKDTTATRKAPPSYSAPTLSAHQSRRPLHAPPAAEKENHPARYNSSNHRKPTATTTRRTPLNRLQPRENRLSQRQRPSSARIRPNSAQRQRPLQSNTAGATLTRPSSARRRSSISNHVPPPRSANYRKRVNDPVKRYQQLQRTWGNDRFLNNRKKNHKSLRMQVRREMREISQEAESFGYVHNF